MIAVATIPKSSLGLVLFWETRLGRFLRNEGGSKQECRNFRFFCSENLHSGFKAQRVYLFRATTHTYVSHKHIFGYFGKAAFSRV